MATARSAAVIGEAGEAELVRDRVGRVRLMSGEGSGSTQLARRQSQPNIGSGQQRNLGGKGGRVRPCCVVDATSLFHCHDLLFH